MQQQYSDLPEGAQVVSQPQVQTYSDLPQGAEIVHDPKDSGAFKRFAARALGVPEDVFDHPNKWLNPFSKEYNSPEHKAEQQQMIPTEAHVPGAQTVQDLKSGNYAGAAGDVITPAIQLAGLASVGRTVNTPVEVPNVYEGPMPAEIPAGKPQSGPGIINRAAQAVASAGGEEGSLGHEVVGALNPRLAHLQAIAKRVAALTGKTPIGERPVYGNVSNAEARGPYQPLQGDLTVAPESAGQNPVPQEVAPALEKASGELSRLPSQSALSGESALRQVLTGQDNANLMRIAKARGLNVAREAQLKPGIADKLLVNKIIADFEPEELDEVGAKFTEASRFKHNFGDVGSEAWKSMSMQTYFPDVKLPAAVVKRVNAAIQAAAPKATPVASPIPEQAMAQAAAAGAPIPQELAPQLATERNMEDLLKQSLRRQLLMKRGLK